MKFAGPMASVARISVFVFVAISLLASTTLAQPGSRSETDLAQTVHETTCTPQATTTVQVPLLCVTAIAVATVVCSNVTIAGQTARQCTSTATGGLNAYIAIETGGSGTFHSTGTTTSNDDPAGASFSLDGSCAWTKDHGCTATKESPGNTGYCFRTKCVAAACATVNTHASATATIPYSIPPYDTEIVVATGSEDRHDADCHSLPAEESLLDLLGQH